MSHTVTTSWQEGLRFEADVQGHTLLLDVPARVGGQDAGPIPKPLLLAALSGCTGMDVASIMNQSPTPLTQLQIEVHGELTTSAPITYAGITLSYTAEGPAAAEARLIQAVRRSLDKICGVAHLLKQVVPLAYTITFNGTRVHEGGFTPREAVA